VPSGECIEGSRKRRVRHAMRNRLVTHTCLLPCYSGGRDLEDHGSKPAWASSPRDPISKKPITKKDWCSGSSCRPRVQAPGPKKKERNRVTREASI
jgi:hypothetical protein